MLNNPKYDQLLLFNQQLSNILDQLSISPNLRTKIIALCEIINLWLKDPKNQSINDKTPSVIHTIIVYISSNSVPNILVESLEKVLDSIFRINAEEKIFNHSIDLDHIIKLFELRLSLHL